MQKFIVSDQEAGQTLEKYVKKVLKAAPLSVIYKLFRKKDIKVNGHWQKEKYILSSGEEVSVFLVDEKLSEFKKNKEYKQNESLKDLIIYEDDNVILINKPRGLLVQKASEEDIALDEMVISYLIEKKEYDPNKNLGYTPAPSHRLDRNTAGIVIFGKNLKTLQYLSKVMSDKNKIEKKYITLVKGHIDESGEINAPLLKKQTHVEVNYKDGKEAITRYKLIKYVGDFSLVEVTLLTGRTHQIRVHFSHIDHPVVGDSKYGDFSLNKEIERNYKFKNQFLIAYHLKFMHLEEPLANLNNKTFEIPLLGEYLDLINNLDVIINK